MNCRAGSRGHLQMGKQATTRLLIMLCVLVQACYRSAAIEGSRPDPKLQIIQDSAAIVLCQKEDGKSGCQTVDPCGQCGRGRCSNLDDTCMGAGILKSGFSCNLRWAKVPAGVDITFYNLWGPWSFNSNDCAISWWCYRHKFSKALAIAPVYSKFTRPLTFEMRHPGGATAGRTGALAVSRAQSQRSDG